jgi:hypothetical protein
MPADVIKQEAENQGCEQPGGNGPSQDDETLSAEVPTTHPGQQVEALFFFISCKQGHNAAVADS